MWPLLAFIAGIFVPDRFAAPSKQVIVAGYRNVMMLFKKDKVTAVEPPEPDFPLGSNVDLNDDSSMVAAEPIAMDPVPVEPTTGEEVSAKEPDEFR